MVGLLGTHALEQIQSDLAHEVTLVVKISDIDWKLLQSAYDWTILQYQASARGTLVLNSNGPQRAVCYTDNNLDF